MNIQELYTELRGDYANAKQRLINEEMVTHFVKRFMSDPTMQNLRSAVSAGDIETSFRAVHTLKGLAANLSFTELYQAACNLTEQLRPRLEQADPALLAELEKEYQRTYNAIKAFSEN